MIANERYPADVLVQIAAAQAALSRVCKVVLREHIESVAREAVQTRNSRERREKLDELLELVLRAPSAAPLKSRRPQR